MYWPWPVLDDRQDHFTRFVCMQDVKWSNIGEFLIYIFAARLPVAHQPQVESSRAYISLAW